MKRFSYVLTFLGVLLTANFAGAQELRATSSDACRDYASLGYQCCIYVRGHRESPRCHADFFGRQSRLTEMAVEKTASILVNQMGQGAAALRLHPVSYLVGHFITHRIDFTGMDSLAGGLVARCLGGESVPAGPGIQREGRVGYSNPHFWSGQAGYRVNEEQVRAYIEKAHNACREQTMRAAVAHVQRVRGPLEWCGVYVEPGPGPQPIVGPTPAAPAPYVQPRHYCSQRAPNCCWRNYLISTSNAYCETDPLPRDSYTRVCARSVAP